MKTQTRYSDQQIASIWICNFLISKKEYIQPNLRKMLGNLPHKIKDDIFRSLTLFGIRSGFSKNTILVNYFEEIISGGNIRIHDHTLNKVSLDLMKFFYLTSKNYKPIYFCDLGKRLGNMRQTFNELGHPISKKCLEEFIVKTLCEMIQQIFSKK